MKAELLRLLLSMHLGTLGQSAHRPAHCSLRPDAVVSCDVYERLAPDDVQFVCVAVDHHAPLPRESKHVRHATSAASTEDAEDVSPRGRSPARPPGSIFWRIFGALGGQIGLARAKFVPYAAVYGTEGHRFESCRARCSRAIRRS
jgi:hypothetical protein